MINEQSGIILFDGYCNLCNGFVRFIIRHDPKALFKFASLQSVKGRTLLEEHGIKDYSGNSIVYIQSEKCYFKSKAALLIIRKLNYPFKLLYFGIILPHFLSDGIYNLVAKYRYRLFGRKDQCMIPEESILNRFL